MRNQNSRVRYQRIDRGRLTPGLAIVSVLISLLLVACGSSTATTGGQAKASSPSGSSPTAGGTGNGNGPATAQLQAEINKFTLPAPETRSLTVPLPGNSDGWTGLYVAEYLNIFQHFGLNVKVVPAKSTQVTSLYLAKTCEICWAVPGVVSALVAEHQQIEVPFVTGWYQFYRIVAQKDIASPQQLVGKPIGITESGGLPQQAFEEYLQHVGLNPSKETYVSLGTAANLVAGMSSGSIQATATGDPGLYEILKTVPGSHVLASLESFHLPAPTAPVVIRPSWAAANKNTVLAFLEAYFMGVQIGHANPAIAEAALAKYDSIPTSNTGLLDASYKEFASVVPSPYSQTHYSKVLSAFKTAYAHPNAVSMSALNGILPSSSLIGVLDPFFNKLNSVFGQVKYSY